MITIRILITILLRLRHTGSTSARHFFTNASLTRSDTYMKKRNLLIPILIGVVFPMTSLSAADVYQNFPITVQGYSGDKTDSTSYSGQVARHLLHNSLKKLAGKGNGEPNGELKGMMMAYFSGKEEGRAILIPISKEGFIVKQASIDEISKGKNLSGKTYKGAVAGWPGYMTASEVLEFMIDKASSANQGFDPVTGYDYPQLISKFLMGAVFYNQAVDKYLDESLGADQNTNDKAYKEGTPYTGKEHVWDEGFGYFGAPVHALSLDAKQAYGISKGKHELMSIADFNQDGSIDLKREMTYAHAYYAADADKSGKTNYLHNITRAFLDGRMLIVSAGGNALTDEQRADLMSHAASIKSNWEKVIAEATFKYAGSVYKDLQKLMTIIEADGNVSETFRAYAKHWGEMKGFALALQTSGKDLGETSVKLNRLIGFSPVHLGGGQVIGIDPKGNYQIGETVSMGEYMAHMIKVQILLAERFELVALKNNSTAALADLLESLGESKSAETD